MPNMLHASKQLFRSIWKKTSRKLLRGSLLFASEDRKTRAERWLRGGSWTPERRWATPAGPSASTT